MPIYCHVCEQCDHVFDKFRSMVDSDEVTLCPKCSGSTRRDWSAEHPMVRRTEDYAHPIHSDSLAMDPSQVAEHRRRFPNIKVDSECRPVFDNYVEHDKYLTACGLVKNTQKIRKRKYKPSKRVSIKQPST